MLIEIIRFIIVLAGAVSGDYASHYVDLPEGLGITGRSEIILFMLFGALIGYLIGGVAGRRLHRSLLWAERALQKVPLPELLAGIAGLVLGLLVAFLVSLPLGILGQAWQMPRLFAVVLLYVILGASGVRLATRRWQDLGRDGYNPGFSGLLTGDMLPGSAVPKLLDTNILIDGRIVDVCKSGFIEGELVLPRFVLAELQAIADSEDDMRRSRGRRGLDVLNAIQEDAVVQVTLTDRDFPEERQVDAKLVRLAKEMGAAILTNDYNLNKVAKVEGVKILNLNELTNAVKSILAAGEELVTKLHKPGKEAGQAVGYLEDGTMVVVDGGSALLGKTVASEVTGVLQTPAGRMVFAKLKAEVPSV